MFRSESGSCSRTKTSVFTGSAEAKHRNRREISGEKGILPCASFPFWSGGGMLEAWADRAFHKVVSRACCLALRGLNRYGGIPFQHERRVNKTRSVPPQTGGSKTFPEWECLSKPDSKGKTLACTLWEILELKLPGCHNSKCLDHKGSMGSKNNLFRGKRCDNRSKSWWQRWFASSHVVPEAWLSSYSSFQQTKQRDELNTERRPILCNKRLATLNQLQL